MPGTMDGVGGISSALCWLFVACRNQGRDIRRQSAVPCHGRCEFLERIDPPIANYRDEWQSLALEVVRRPQSLLPASLGDLHNAGRFARLSLNDAACSLFTSAHTNRKTSW